MHRSKRYLYIYLVIAITVLIGFVIFSACDSRKPISSTTAKITSVSEITIIFDPPQVNIYNENEIDTVTVDITVTDDEGVGIDNLDVDLSRSPNIGAVTKPEATSTQGHYQAKYFTALNGYGDIEFRASVGDVYAVDTLSVIQQALVSNITIFFNPQYVVLYGENDIDTVNVSILVADENGIGLDNLDVALNIIPNLGTITNPQATGSGGYYQSQYITAPGRDVDITFTATAGSMSISDTLSIFVQPANTVEEIFMSFNPQPLIIHSPFKSDTALIDIWVRDANGVSLDSIMVQVSRMPEVGTIVPPGLTEDGYAQGMYITDPGIYQDVGITVNVGEVTITDTLLINVQLLGEIGSMNISLQKQILIADGMDATSIFVSVTDTTGIPIGDGTIVFIQNYGPGTQGTLNESSGYTENGIATFTITAPPILNPDLIVESDSIRAWGVSLSGDTVYAYSAVTYVPGEPNDLNIITIPEEMVAGSGESQIFEVLVTDENNNRVIDGTQVQFANVLETSSITDITTTLGGMAEGVYVVGTEAGLDVIKAFRVTPGTTDTLWSNAIPLTVRSAEGSNIAITAEPTTIEVGGIACNVYATMQDENDNPLSEGFPVMFEITSHPGAHNTRESPSFEYVPTDDSVLYVTIDSTDVNGRASVSLFSGTTSGTVTIKATSVDNPNIFKEKPLVVIESGPPMNVAISGGANPYVDGAILVSDVTAVVSDSFTNPVECSTAVHFELIPDSIAEINGDAFTGGCIDTVTGETLGTPGLAHTWLAYPCYSTFDTIQIITYSGELIDTSILLPLGLYEGTIYVGANPASIWLSNPGESDTSDIESELTDGLHCPIEHGVIDFSARNAGQIVEGMERDTTDEYGHAYSKFFIFYEQIPPNPPNDPNVTAEAVAKLRGYPDIEGKAEIVCRRPPG